jgi:shikimate kinase
MKKIILLGYMGSGKTTIAKLVSEKLEISCFDLDNLIENETKLSVQTIFKQKGEIYFRKIESQIFKKTITQEGSFILSLGGGTPCYAENHLLLNSENVISIYLKASIDTLYNRLLIDKKQRPLVADKSEDELKEFIAKHLFERSFFYNQTTFKIAIDDKRPHEIVSEIMKVLI